MPTAKFAELDRGVLRGEAVVHRRGHTDSASDRLALNPADDQLGQWSAWR